MELTEADLQKATWMNGTPENIMGLAVIWGTLNQNPYYVAVHVRPDDKNPEKFVASRGFVTPTDDIENILTQSQKKHECDILDVDEREDLLDYLGALAQTYVNKYGRQEADVKETPVKPSFWKRILNYFS